MLLRFRRSQNGSAAVEFAVVAPLFFFLMFVIAQTALVFIAEQVMDNAVFDTARLVRTGQVQKQTPPMTQAQFRTKVCDSMSVFVKCTGSADFYLDVKSYDTFDEMNKNLGKPVKPDDTFNAEGTYDFGAESDIIVVRAYYKWPTPKIYGNLFFANAVNGKLTIGSFAAFKNEPFGK